MFHIQDSQQNILPLLESLPWENPSMDALMNKYASLRFRFCDPAVLKAQRSRAWKQWCDQTMNPEPIHYRSLKLKEHNNMFLTITEKVDKLNRFLGFCRWKGSCADNEFLDKGTHGSIFKTEWVDPKKFLRKCNIIFGKTPAPRGKGKCIVHKTIKGICHWFENEPPQLLTGLHVHTEKTKERKRYWKLNLANLVGIALLMRPPGGRTCPWPDLSADMKAIRNKKLDRDTLLPKAKN